MSERDPFELLAIENPLSAEVMKLRATQRRLFRRNVEAGQLSELSLDDDLEKRVYDPDTGVLIFVQSQTDLYDEFGFHANMISFSPKGVVQFYVSFADGKIYGELTMDEIKYVIDALVNNGLAERFFRFGTRDNGTTPEGVIDYGGQETPESITNSDFDSGLDNWNVLSQAYTKDVINTSLPAEIITCMAMDINGNIYAGFASTGTTSAVWKLPVGTTTWEAVGTLSTAFNILAIACDSAGNVYVGGDNLTTSAVWKWNGSTWAAHGTLTATFDVRSLVIDSNDKIYAGTDNGTTSRVWSVASGSTTWAAVGTLTQLAVYAMVKDDSNNIYAVGDGSATSSAWWWNGSAWAALGTLNTSNLYRAVDIDLATGYLYAVGDQDLVYWNTSAWVQINDSLFYTTGVPATTSTGRAIAYINNSIVVGRNTGDVSGEDSYGSLTAFDVNGSYKKIDLDYTDANAILALLKSVNDFYIGGVATLDVIKYTLADSWDASNNEYVEITASELTPALVLGTRFAVTAGEQRQVKCANYIQAVGGIGTAKLDIEFWTAVTGGTLVSTENIFSRQFDDAVGALQELSDIVTVPATATHATLVLSAEVDTATSVTVRFDDFEVREVTNFVRLKMNDDGLFAEKDGLNYKLNDWITTGKETDESKASDTTLAADSVLQFPMLANTKYAIRLVVYGEAPATPDFKFDLNGPASPTLIGASGYSLNAGATVTHHKFTAYNTSTAILGGGGSVFINLEIVVQNGANAGTFSFRWAQNTSNATPSKVYAGSYLQYKKV